MNPFHHSKNRQCGFTLIELVMIIVIIGILAATVYVRWPVGMEEDAAANEFRRALRYAQHKAMTRQFTNNTAAWGITVNANASYTVQRIGGGELAEQTYVNRCLTSENPPPCEIPLAGGPVYFNGIGEPLNAAGNPIAGTTIFTIGAPPNTRNITISPVTGYVN
ncbi:MAG: type II secretion system GspH family protein [Proteobacteria bacterium]|nr:type II secretion system GspH family protein [Pseudomonadota bacterium]